MSFYITLLVLIAGIVLALRAHKRTATAMLVIAVVSMFTLGSGPGAGMLLRSIQGPYEDSHLPRQWPARSAIIVLGMGTVTVAPGKAEVNPLAYGRVVSSAEAYRNCRRAGGECKVIMTGGESTQGFSEARIYATQMIALGVEQADLILEEQSRSTWENAKFTKAIVETGRFDQTYLVTSGVHMRLALLYFGHFGVRPVPIRTDYLMPWPTFVPMAYNFATADLALSEYRGLLRYRFYNAMGWND